MRISIFTSQKHTYFRIEESFAFIAAMHLCHILASLPLMRKIRAYPIQAARISLILAGSKGSFSGQFPDHFLPVMFFDGSSSSSSSFSKNHLNSTLVSSRQNLWNTTSKYEKEIIMRSSKIKTRKYGRRSWTQQQEQLANSIVLTSAQKS